MPTPRTAWLAVTAPAATKSTANGAPVAEYVVQAPGRIVRVQLTLPPGSSGLLHVTPQVVRQGNDPQSLVEFGEGGDQYLSGDGVPEMGFDTDVPVDTGDVIRAAYDNSGATYPHWFALQVTIGPPKGAPANA